ncbi:hypothetical protein PHYSODRAFT_322569 [Phytophthora sojae]|uniref:Uncharacterized protein n=1 Tax=Phytophthora sojae (strain P6497) TaxID=1094619 RepID=G4YPX2_PHYSP|nr:hypothetical protein PHYSODRAFT_322569 [Phytophthora sojae]EGZ28967.1 hypothetical protein PHYSODRAFT_322569 [Phytophthora sojae]|eukprot:XP_009516242.1 hypothetical protein PHYSODRAFT_322569 [Phytophthora sojae]
MANDRASQRSRHPPSNYAKKLDAWVGEVSDTKDSGNRVFSLTGSATPSTEAVGESDTLKVPEQVPCAIVGDTVVTDGGASGAGPVDAVVAAGFVHDTRTSDVAIVDGQGPGAKVSDTLDVAGGVTGTVASDAGTADDGTPGTRTTCSEAIAGLLGGRISDIAGVGIEPCTDASGMSDATSFTDGKRAMALNHPLQNVWWESVERMGVGTPGERPVLGYLSAGTVDDSWNEAAPGAGNHVIRFENTSRTGLQIPARYTVKNIIKEIAKYCLEQVAHGVDHLRRRRVWDVVDSVAYVVELIRSANLGKRSWVRPTPLGVVMDDSSALGKHWPQLGGNLSESDRVIAIGVALSTGWETETGSDDAYGGGGSEIEIDYGSAGQALGTASVSASANANASANVSAIARFESETASDWIGIVNDCSHAGGGHQHAEHKGPRGTTG